MAIIRPFRALRPPKELVEHVAALPYDVMDVEEARAMAAGNRDSFLHISRPEIDLPAEIDPHDDIVYVKGHENLQEFIRRGLLIRDPDECFYVYRQVMGSLTQTGLVVCAGVDDYQSGVIKKHELTRADKEEDRVKHIDLLDANDEPVFYLFRSCSEIEEIISGITTEEPEYDFTATDGVSHTLWVVKDPDTISRLTILFTAIPNLYVADGHHRSAAAGRVRELRREANPRHTGDEEYNYFLTVIFPEDQLHIMPYNRVVKDLNGLTCSAFIDRLSPLFEITPSESAVAPAGRHLFGMYLEGKWYRLQARHHIVNEADTVNRLDVSILQNNLLNPILGIENPRTDKRIHFVGGIRGNDELVRLVDSGEYAVAFSLHPTSISELVELADQDQIMPPKSTWFEPKLRSGLFVHMLSDITCDEEDFEIQKRVEERRARILVVDDEPVNVQILEAVLSHDYDVDTASGGQDALNKIKLNKPDLILLDVMMPGLNGFDVCNFLKANDQFKNIPVIFLTAMDSQEGEARGLEAGGIDYITKPVQFELVRLRVRNQINLVKRNEIILLQRDLLTQKQKQLIELNNSLDRDVHRAVTEIREKDQMMVNQSRQAAMGEMIGNIAHQWRQPLNTLAMLFTNLRNAYQYNELNEQYLDKSCATADRLIQKMSTTINDFRNFFHPDKEPAHFSAQAQIEQALTLVEASLASQNITITCHTSPDIILFGFPNEFSQVLLNLLINAKDAIIDHATGGGAIEITLYERDEYGCVSVRDNGGGIPDGVIDKIFDPYFSTKKMGTGIGLYMSKMIIERSMKGGVTAHNNNDGAEFIIAIPLSPMSRELQ